MAALQRVAQSSISTTASSYGSCKGAGVTTTTTNTSTKTATSSSAAVASEMVVSDKFPVGLRVLVVDDDTTCLTILEKMLRRCLYHGLLLLLFASL